MEKHLWHRAFLLSLALAISGGCERNADQSGPRYATAPREEGVHEYHVAIHPLHNPTRLSQAYQPLLSYLSQHLSGCQFILEASRDYAAFEQKVAERTPDLILPNPWQALQAMRRGYHVIAMAGDPSDFKGLWIVRNDSGIRSPADLKGKIVCYPSPTALAACIMPQFFLHQHGVDVRVDVTNLYVGSQESSIMNVFLGTAAAGATWPPPWRAFQRDHPEEAGALQVIWETGALINNAVMIRDDVPSPVRDSVRALLVHLQGTPEGRAILSGMETARFHEASDESYEVVRRFVARFEREVRKVVDR
jgi:phosphonate transport system substrate-binding protein